MSNNAYLDSSRLNKYLNGKLCREERQFAAMLFYIFLEEKKKKNGTVHPIIKRCLNLKDITAPIEIKEVYFEATLMRDFFENDRLDFNKQLLKYCLRGMYMENDNKVYNVNNTLIDELMKNQLKITLNGIKSSRNLGQRKAKERIRDKYPELKTVKKEIETGNTDSDYIKILKERVCLDIAGMMMNATPDLLIVYEYKSDNTSNSNTHVKALECKYLSKEGTYKDVADAEYKMQFFIQECIMQFCFGKSEKDVILPSCPSSRSIWGKNEELWYSTYGEVYEKILTQDWQSNDLSNAGVEIIQFIKEPNKKNITNGSVPIYIHELITYTIPEHQ